jgi:hypothetical protein
MPVIDDDRVPVCFGGDNADLRNPWPTEAIRPRKGSASGANLPGSV